MLLITMIYLLCLIVWIGEIVFFSFVGAPTLFRILAPDAAGKAVGALFPKYYPIGYLSGIVAFLCLIFSAAKTGSWPVLKMLVLALMVTLTVYSSLVLHPRARAIKEEISLETGKTDVAHLKAEFDHAHRITVIYNGIVLVLGLALVFLTARGLSL